MKTPDDIKFVVQMAFMFGCIIGLVISLIVMLFVASFELGKGREKPKKKIVGGDTFDES